MTVRNERAEKLGELGADVVKANWTGKIDEFAEIVQVSNVPVVVEAGGDIASPTWTPISTNTLMDGWVQFTDPDWKSQPARFYRVRGQ